MKLQRPLTPLKKMLKDAEITYSDVAREAKVSWSMAWLVFNGRRRSASVVAAARRLLERRR